MSEHAQEPQGASTATLPDAEQVFIDSLPTGDESQNTPAPADTAAEAVTESEGTTDPLAIPDSFTPADVRGMLEGIADPEARAVAEAAVKNFQADYTKSKQHLSEQASQFEGLDDLEKARAAVEFYDGIQNDPEFALEVHAWMTKAFEDMGMSTQEAEQAAAVEMAQPSDAAAATPSFDEDPDAALKSQLDSLQARQDRWEQEEAARREQQRIDELAGDLLRQEMALRQSHEDLTDADLDRIYDLAQSRGGNLIEAHQQYVDWQQDTINRYMDTKQKDVPPAEPTPGSTSVPPEVPRLADGTPDLEAVHRIAVQRLQNAMAGRE